MKNSVVVALLGLFFASGEASAQMIADIRDPVETDFGTYEPYVVSVQPSIPPLEVAADFSNVVNFDRFEFTESELELLRQNHFVVSPRRLNGGTGYGEMYDVYSEARELGIPILVTTDAMLHTFHLVFDHILKNCEEQRFYGLLESLLAKMYEETLAQQAAATDTLAKWALWRNIEYLNVARCLFDTTFVPPTAIGLCQQELDLLAQQGGFATSSIFQYPEDYTQYMVRGHYTRSDSLRRYFKTMMWLGRMTFDREDSAFTLGALLLTQALLRAQIDTHPVFNDWNDIYQTTVFFVGKSDDIGPDQYNQIGNQVYGRSFLSLSPDELADRGLLSQFQQLALDLPGPKIKPGFQPDGFRVMGQRFIPDSYVLDQLVFGKIPDPRLMPTGLDVMAALGSARALELLKQTPDWTMFPSYPVRLNALCEEFANYTPETWAQNVYWNWLYCLMPLFSPKGAGYPDWMQTPAWVDKDLLAALASWAELRHDTILYAKQSYTEPGMKPDAIGKQGFVEPNPELYARLAALARFMRTGLENRSLLFPAFENSLNRLHDLLVQLYGISEKELGNRPLSVEEYQTILSIGAAIEDIVAFAEWPTGGPHPDDEIAMPVIADVHTDANTNTVLEEGVGYPYCIYAISPVEGQLVLTRGAGFSYHEFVWPSNDRLTDETWRQKLQSRSNPPPPEWCASFIAEGLWANPQPDFYYWKTGGTKWHLTRILADTVELGKPVLAEIKYFFGSLDNYGNPADLTVWVETATGQKVFADSLVRVAPSTWVASISTSGLQAGRAWVVTQAPAKPVFSDDSLLVYRAGFVIGLISGIESASEVELPRSFALLAPWPNPFNAGVSISFEIPNTGEIELGVFDVTGRHVRALAKAVFAAGRHRLNWDGLDDLGNSAASGIYLVRLKAGKNVASQKVLMLR